MPTLNDDRVKVFGGLLVVPPIVYRAPLGIRNISRIAPLASDGFSLSDATDGLGTGEPGGAGLTWTGATWTVAAGAVSNAPTQGAEVHTNGGAEGTYVAGVAPSWTVQGGVTAAEEGTIIHGGAKAQKGTLTSPGLIGFTADSEGLPVVTGTWYLSSVWVRVGVGTDTIRKVFNDSVSNHTLDTTGVGTTYQQVLSVHRSGATGNGFTRIQAATNGIVFYIDDASLKPLTLSTLFRSLQLATADVFHLVQVSALTSGTQAGLVIRLDNAANPTKGIVVYFDGAGNIKCDEFTTAAAWTNLTSGAKAFTANDWVGIEAKGTAINIYHITNAGVKTLIASGTTTVTTGSIVGLFDTYGNNFNAMYTMPV